MLDEVVNEYIESHKIRDRKLFKEFGAEKEAIPILKNPNRNEEETEKEKEERISK